MSRVTARMRDFGGRLIAEEAKVNPKSGSNPAPAFRVCEKLRPHLARLMGGTGFHALLSRALALAREDASWLRGVQVQADGGLALSSEIAAPLAPEESNAGGVVLVAQVLGLLVAFIGENLMFRMVREVWPKVSFSPPGSDEEN